jgi:hypothetical protein
MEHERLTKPLTPVEVTLLLSQAMHDLKNRKITLRQALTLSRVATALVKSIETTELKARVELLEQTLKKR